MSCLWLFSLATIGLTLSHIEEVEARDFSWPSVEGSLRSIFRYECGLSLNLV